MKLNSFSAQGTIEYLVIMAIVIVIGLLVVGVVSNLFSSSSGVSSGVGNINSKIGPISISEVVVDGGGDGYSAFQNTSGETLTITKVTLGGIDNNYDKQVFQGNTEIFRLSELTSGCTCSTPGERKTCSMTIYYTSSLGLTDSITKTISVDCVGDATTDQDATNPQEDDAPVISLSGPADNNVNVSGTVVFEYSVTDASNIFSCELIIDGEVDQTDNTTPFDSFSKNLSTTDVSYDWDINCTDEHGNIGTVDNRTVSLFTGYTPVTTCSSITTDTNYVLVNDITGYSSGNCFVFDGDEENVTFNCNNNLISATGSGEGFSFTRDWASRCPNDILVTKCNITNFSMGIRSYSCDSSDINIVDNNIYGNGTGIELNGSSNFIIVDNNISNNNWGMYIAGSTDTLIQGNIIENSGYRGILTGNNNGGYLRIYDNNIDGSGHLGHPDLKGGIVIPNSTAQLLNNRVGCITPNTGGDYICETSGTVSGSSYRSDSSSCRSVSMSSC